MITTRPRHRLSLSLRLICFLMVALTAQLSVGAPYAFKKIADNSGPLREFSGGRGAGAPSINNSGKVAFWATLDLLPGQIIGKGSGGPFQTVADLAGGFSDLGWYPDINDAGTTVFSGGLITGSRGVYASSGGPPTPVIDNAGQFDFFGSGPTINENGAVAFSASFDGGGSGNFRSDSGAVTTIVDSVGAFSNFSGSQLNNNGALVFWALRNDNAGSGIFRSSGGPLETISDTSGPFNSFGFSPSSSGYGRLPSHTRYWR